jgi:amphiphysin
MPANDYINLHKQIVKTFTKRDHKKIDYDRHSDTLKKAKTAQEDDRKVMKVNSNNIM